MVGIADSALIEATIGSPDGEDPFLNADGDPLVDKVTKWL